MQIVINFNEIDLSEWIECDEDGAKAPELKEVFKDEILEKFLQKLNADIEVRRYIRDNIEKGLYNKIAEYRDDVAIKAIVEEIITQKIKACGSFIFIDQYKSRVENEVKKYLAHYESQIDDAIRDSVRDGIKEKTENLLKNSAMREFIDTDKLSRYVEKTIEEKWEATNEGCSA